MNWDDMRVFLAVARTQSLSAAAPILQMDAATVSRRIARLETDLGLRLFVKSPLGYALTERGTRLVEHAHEAEEAFALAAEEGQGAGRGLTGHIRIGAPDGCANYLLPPVCAALQAENPELEIQILALPRVANLSRREADMAITVSPPSTGQLTVQKVTDYHLHLAARADIAGQIKTRDDLRGRPVVGYIPDMIFDKELDYLGALSEGGVHLASNSVAVQAHLLRAAQAIGIVHDFAFPSHPELRPILTDDICLKRSFYLVRHVSDRRSERLKRVVSALTSGIRAEVARLEAIAA